jgi:hypothetical protein
MTTSAMNMNESANDDSGVVDRLNREAADEPLERGPRGAPQAPDPQQGQLTDDPSHDPQSARPMRPRTGEPFGP